MDEMGGQMQEGYALLIEVRRRWRELKSLEEERAEVAARLYSISSPRLDVERVQGGSPKGLEMKAEKLIEYYERIKDEYAAVYDAAMKARRIIAMLPDATDRLLLREYFLRGKSYGAIAQDFRMGKERVIATTDEAVLRFCACYEREKETAANQIDRENLLK